MKNNIKIVLAKPKDLDAIHEILIQRCKWFKDNHIDQWKLDWYPKKYNNEYFLKQIKENFLYVSKNKKEVVGVMLLKKKDEKYWSNDNNSYFLHHFATKLENKGVGKIMLKFACNKCLKDKKKYLRLDSKSSNDRLTKYYESMSFINVKVNNNRIYKYKLWEKKIEN